MPPVAGTDGESQATPMGGGRWAAWTGAGNGAEGKGDLGKREEVSTSLRRDGAAWRQELLWPESR